MPTELTDKELIQRLANAEATYSGCLGHTKAHMNEQMMQKWAGLLAERGLHFDTAWHKRGKWKLGTEGVYGGVGSQ